MNMSKPSWLEYKQGLGFDFPNLPYYQVVYIIIIVNHYISIIINIHANFEKHLSNIWTSGYF